MSEAALAASLDGWMSGLAEQQLFSGAVLVRHDGRDVWSKAYGLANRSASLAATVDTPFNFGSIGKILTHTAIIQLAEAGKLSLDDTVGKWLPAYPQAVSRTATIEQLIGHRGGIADFFGPAFARTPKSQFTANRAYYDLISHQPPLFAPGEREQYCNGCYAVLGEIIAAATGVSYETYVRDNILLHYNICCFLLNTSSVRSTTVPSSSTLRNLLVKYIPRNLSMLTSPGIILDDGSSV
jgi:CubicO group peptidase (beta-lactamase class C family)